MVRERFKTPPIEQQTQIPKEGTVIFNKETGKRKIVKNGVWEDM